MWYVQSLGKACHKVINAFAFYIFYSAGCQSRQIWRGEMCTLPCVKLYLPNQKDVTPSLYKAVKVDNTSSIYAVFNKRNSFFKTNLTFQNIHICDPMWIQLTAAKEDVLPVNCVSDSPGKLPQHILTVIKQLFF